MSTNRDEIRWKFQVLSDLLSSSQDSHNSEKKDLEENWEKMIDEFTEVRNTILGAIGFGIALLISLISIGILGKETSWYIPIGIVIGAAIFISINSYLFRAGQKISRILEYYRQSTMEMISFRGWIAGRSMREDVTLDQMVLLLLFSVAFAQSISYDLKNLSYKNLKGKKPDQEESRQGYDIAKKYQKEFSSIGLGTYDKRIESFITLFEFNEGNKV